MVCKEEIVSWFKSLKSNTRIDVMCNLFNLCLPFELRFLGTCLEDLGKRDFHDLRTTESGANNPSELISPDLQCISDKRARTKLALYISLLHSCNYACSNGYYKVLANVEEVNNLIKCNGLSSADDEVLEELLLIYTLALNHPAFTFEQKLFLGEVFTKLQQEEERRNFVRRTRSVQASMGMGAIDKIPIQFQAYPASTSPDQPNLPPLNSAGHCTPITPAALTGDPLVSMADPLVGFVPYSLMTGYHTMMLPPPPPEQRSPMVSRTNSPCQSNSPSRAGSPGRHKPMPTTFTRPPPLVEPLPHTPYLPPKYASMDQLRHLSDDELRENGWNNQSINQFRNLEARHHSTNGYSLGPKKHPQTELDLRKDFGSGPLRRYNSVDGPLNPSPFFINPSCLCYMSYPRQHQGNTKSLPPHFLNHVRSMNLLDHDTCSPHNSSTSDSASDHSPPDTPSLSNATDRVMQMGPPEVWEEQRIPDLEERRGLVAAHGRPRGMGRGIHPHSRGRGHNHHRRRETNSANGTLDERKMFTSAESGMAFPYGQFPLPNQQFIHTYHPTFTSPSGVLRLPFPHLNGEMVYHSMPPPVGQPFLPTRPSPVAYSPLVPPPKIVSCYNCGSQGHSGPDCPEATIEEITNKGQYKIDYTNNVLYPKPGDCSSTQDK